MPSPSSPPAAVSSDQLTLLVAHALGTHDLQLGRLVCTPWCHACRVLADLPADLLDAGRQHLAGIAADIRDITS